MCILSHCPPLIKRVAHQLQSGVTLRNKTQERKKKTQPNKPHNHTYFTTNMLRIRQIQFLELLSSNISQSEETKSLSQKEKREGTDVACSLTQCIALDKVWKEKPVVPFLPHQDKMCK